MLGVMIMIKIILEKLYVKVANSLRSSSIVGSSAEGEEPGLIKELSYRRTLW